MQVHNYYRPFLTVTVCWLPVGPKGCACHVLAGESSDGWNLCRRGIEELNDELLTRGFAMNEEGGILKASDRHHLLQSWKRSS